MPRAKLYCSFCGKSQGDVQKLVAGPTVFVCNECHDLIGDAMKDERNAAEFHRPKGLFRTRGQIDAALASASAEAMGGTNGP